MRKLLLFAMLVCWPAWQICHAEEEKTAKLILGKAIDALGGFKLLQEEKAISGSSQGKVIINNVTSKLSNDWIVQGLDQIRWSSEVVVNEKPIKLLIVANSKSAWIKSGNNEPSTPEQNQLSVFRQAMAGLRLAESPNLLRDPAFKLSTLGEMKIQDRPAVGIKASHKGLPDLDLFFDKSTSYPVQAQMRLKESGDQEATWTAQFLDYKKEAGRPRFTRLIIKREDSIVFEMLRSNMKGHSSMDESTFDKP